MARALYFARSLNEDNIKEVLNIIIYFMPTVISLIQLALCFTVFKYNTPMELLEDTVCDDAISELKRMYYKRAIYEKEYNRIEILLINFNYQYPSYREIFSKKYFQSFIEGGLMVCLQACTESFINFTFYESETYETYIKCLKIMFPIFHFSAAEICCLEPS